MKNSSEFNFVVLAGERQGGNALAREMNLVSGVLVQLAGRACVSWALQALKDSERVGPGLLCGPAQEVLDQSATFRQVLIEFGVKWLSPAAGPAASAGKAVRSLNKLPLLITAADHALLTGEIVDEFCSAAIEQPLDFVVGLVPYTKVKQAFPDSKRTVLKFSDGEFCGSNLFAVLNQNGISALDFWQIVEADRKKPWKIARHLGLGLLARYLSGRLSVAAAFAALSRQSNARVGYVLVEHARAAVDVDSKEDFLLADALLSLEASVDNQKPECLARNERNERGSP